MQTTNDYIRLLSDFKRAHAAEYGITRMGVFGSVARGEHKADSDVDVYYEGNPLGLKSFGLEIALEKLLGVPVDVVRNHRNLNPRFLNHILKEVVYV
jgi:predicted nucleotidyltransferase